MLRQSFGTIARAAARSPAASTSSLRPAVVATKRSYARHYSEASATSGASESDGAQAASTAGPTAGASSAGNGKAKAAEGDDASQKEIEKKSKEIAELKDKWLRSRAELDNAQKRATREVQTAKDYAISNFAKELIDNIDILHLAMRSVPEDKRAHLENAQATTEKDDAGHLADLYIGVEMTARQLEKTMSRFGVSAFDPTGEKFDPNLHEALYQAPVPGKEAGSVLECSKKGWKLKDRVIRAAQVGIVAETA